jgi:solute:Na+ symporter, SSS family
LLGFIISAIVLYLVQRYTAVHFLLYAGIGMCSCALSGYLASFLVGSPVRPLDGLTVFTRGSSPVSAASLPAGADTSGS